MIKKDSHHLYDLGRKEGKVDPENLVGHVGPAKFDAVDVSDVAVPPVDPKSPVEWHVA